MYSSDAHSAADLALGRYYQAVYALRLLSINHEDVSVSIESGAMCILKKQQTRVPSAKTESRYEQNHRNHESWRLPYVDGLA